MKVRVLHTNEVGCLINDEVIIAETEQEALLKYLKTSTMLDGDVIKVEVVE